MAADVKNIIVGAAALFVSVGSGNSRPNTSTASLFPTASQSARAKLLGDSASWRDLGYTNNGLEVSYEPGYNDVMVDQLLDAARLFKSTLKVMLKTELAEGTLQNLNLVFGQQESQYTYSGSVGSASNVLTGTYTGTGTGSAVLNIAAGALGDAPVERTIVAIGNAPGNITTTASGAAFSASASTRSERVYVARRVVQIEVTSHSLKRDAATTFPVQFRCLPDDNDLYDGAEYGVIIDRILA
jgi:hypothetical protein